MFLNIFNLFDRLVRLLQIFFDELSDGYNVEMLIKTLFMNQLKKFIYISIFLYLFIYVYIYIYIYIQIFSKIYS